MKDKMMEGKMMKTRIGIIGLMGVMVHLLTSVATAQGFAVRTLGADSRHEFNEVAGCPTNWPVAVDRLAPGATNPWPDRVVLTEAQLANVYRVIGPSFTNWHRTVWRSHVEGKALQEATRASQREAEVRDAFERADAELASLNTNLLTPSDLLRVIRRQHALLQRVRPRLDATVATNEGASAQPQQAVRAQSIQAMGSQTDRTGQTNSVRRAARSK